MDLVFDEKTATTKSNRFSYLDDALIQNFYTSYYQNLSSKELDKEFNRDIQILVNTLKKLPGTERNSFVQVLSNVIEFYLENKIEKEIDQSLLKILDI